jgi:hypothetical protein
MVRTKAEQLRITPSAEANKVSTVLIAKYGILNALDVAQCIQEQVQAAINQQRRLHPEDWADDTAQPSQPEPQPAKKVPAMPRITG